MSSYWSDLAVYVESSYSSTAPHHLLSDAVRACICISVCLVFVHVIAAKARMDEVLYRRARHVLSENQRCTDAAAALKSADYVTFGQLMTASHNSLR